MTPEAKNGYGEVHVTVVNREALQAIAEGRPVSELKPCPFCGGQPTIANLEPDESRSDPLWRAQCNNVGCLANPSMCERLGRDGIVAIWNKREPLAAPLSDAACDALLWALDEIASRFDNITPGLPVNYTDAVAEMRAAIRLAVAG